MFICYVKIRDIVLLRIIIRGIRAKKYVCQIVYLSDLCSGQEPRELC